MFEHRIEDNQQLPHAGGQGHLFGFAGCTQALAEWGSGLAIQHFAARGGELVQLVYLVCRVSLVCLVQRTK
jgi:hypothetical protein